jgi:acetylornithine deacetylase/succinyl-diaminopimelate desuccinylase-like protein
MTEHWNPGTGPHTPVVKDGKLYGRGGADDGYAIFGAIGALLILNKQNLPHARSVVLIGKTGKPHILLGAGFPK